jgi:hypothetical protein
LYEIEKVNLKGKEFGTRLNGKCGKELSEETNDYTVWENIPMLIKEKACQA